MEIKTSPCKDCMLIPICRNKEFGQFIYDCSLVEQLWKDSRYWEDLMINVEFILKPTHWRVNKITTSSGINTVKILSRINPTDGTEMNLPAVYGILLGRCDED
jgi:hypothetical protein